MSRSYESTNKWWVFATVSCGNLMASIDITAVNLALPALRDQFHINLAQVEWVVLAYLLVNTSLLLTLGRLADVVGRTRLYNLGFVIFTAGSLACGLSPGITALVVSRGLQGIGGSMLISSSVAILLDAFPVSQRGRVLGLNAMMFSTGSIVGPTLGGALLTWFSWRSIFLVNLPVGVVGMTLAFIFLPRQAMKREGNFDIAGSALVGVAIALILLGINTGQQEGWTPRVVALAVAAMVFGAAFVIRQHLAANPLVRFGLFRTPGYPNALVGQAMMTMCNASNLLVLPFFLVSIQGRTEAEAGLIFLANPVISLVASPVGGWLSDRSDARWVASAGALSMLLAFVLLSRITQDWSPLTTIGHLALLSIGNGLFGSPNAAAGYQYVRARERGVAAGTFSFFGNFGFTVGTAVAGSVWTLRRLAEASVLGVEPASIEAQIAGLRDTYLFLAGLILTALVASVLRPRSRRRGFPPLDLPEPAAL